MLQQTQTHTHVAWKTSKSHNPKFKSYIFAVSSEFVCFFFFYFSLCFIMYGPCELSFMKNKFNSRSERRNKVDRKKGEKHKSSDKPSSCDCVYWGLSVFNLLFLLKLHHLQLHLSIWYYMYSHNNHFFLSLSLFRSLLSTIQNYRTLAATHTLVQITTKQQSEKNAEKKQLIATIPSLNIAFAHQLTFACIQMWI